MQKFVDNEATRYAMEKILEMEQSGSDMTLPEKEYFEGFDDATPFRDGIYRRVAELGYIEDLDATAKILDFLCSQCIKNGVGELSRTTLRNWLLKSPPNSSGRNSVFLLCFALEMNAEKVAEFFLKAYLNRPFNYKNTREAVYFHCFLTGKSYRDALRIIETIETIPSTETADRTIATEQIGSEIASITDEEELIRYLASHRYEENEQHQTVVSKITDLLQSCYTLATKETEYTKEKAAVVTSSDALLDVIYDYDAYAMGKEKRTIAKSKLPKAIKENLPDRERLAKLLRHEAKNDDVYRKALVLLTFYNFYAAAYLSQRAYRAESDIDLLGYADDFEAELEGSLFECGYVQLYKRNPFDWLILYCASFPNPLNQFRNVIDEYYLATGDDE